MIPISLTIKGIYSYQEKEQTIQFDHLTDAGVFGIFGSVGSGKSTILEAISYALYGDTERLNRRENRSYNMLNLKSSNLLIDFVFRAGDAHDEYRFTVKGRRNSKKFTDVKSFNREAYKKSGDDWVPISIDSTEEIIGLNYLNFRRTVIIPQGKFQEFLQLSDTDRTRMMKELFRLERFDLQYKVGAMESENNGRLSNLEGQLVQLVEVTTEKIDEIERRIKEKAQAFKQNKKQLELLQKQNEEFEKVQDLFNQINSTDKQYNELNTHVHEFDSLEYELNKYNYCIHNFKFLVENNKRLQANDEKLKEELETLNKRLEKLKKQIKTDEENLKELKPLFDNRESLKIQAEELEKLLKVKELNKEINNLSDRIAKGEKTLNETVLKIDGFIEKKQSVQSKIVQIKDKMPDLNLLSDIKQWYTNYHYLKNELLALSKEKETLTQELEYYATQLRVVFEKIFPNLTQYDADILALKLKEASIEIKGKLNLVEDELRHFKVKEQLSEYANNLHAGQACPVCGSTSHPDKLEESDVAKKITDLNSKKSNLNQELDSLYGFEQKLNELKLKSSSVSENLIKLEQKEKENGQKQSEHLKVYPGKEKMEEKELENQFQLAKSLQIELKNTEKEQSDIEKTYEKELSNKEKFTDLLNEIRNELVSKTTQKQTLSAQIKHIDSEQAAQAASADLKQQINKLLEQYDDISRKFDKLSQNLNNTQSESGRLEGIIQTKKHDFKLNTEELKKTELELQDKIDQSEFSGVDEVFEVLAKKMDVERLTKKISSFRQKLFSLKEQLTKLKEQAKGKEYDAEKHQENRNSILRIKTFTEELGKKLGSLENNAKVLKVDLLQKQKLEAEQKSLKARAENLSVLKAMFKGSGFVNYVSSVYLQNLINAANERFFKLTAQKLQLELTEDNNFEIRDFLNGGKTRSVKTLSGGQTFQASLSLALALADNIQSLSHADHNFFFLDEGFGSLDKESLNVVFSTLKTLRKENRIVGVISHVEDLQQEVETYLKIENNPETGSVINRSWE
jgi:exonuclease SbcC